MTYVNDLPNGLKSEFNLFADDTSLFSAAQNVNTSASDVSNDLKLISDWTFQRKISFNIDSNKQAQEMISSRKKWSHPTQVCIAINNIPVSSTSVYKYIEMFLDGKLSYKHHLKFALNKVRKTVGLLSKFKQIPQRQSLNTICKSFIWPHLDYGDIDYDRMILQKSRIYSI